MGKRYYEVDSLRVYAFLLLILFHAGMPFVPWLFFVKNNETSEWLQIPMFFSHQWRLALLFIISGIGTYFSISRRSIRGFAGERCLRLFIPLIFGILVVVPPQIYFQRLVQGLSYSSYWDFYIHDAFTKGYYGNGKGGNIHWLHLWFVMYLFIYSMVLILFKKPLDLFSPYFKKLIFLWKGFGIFFFLCIPVFLCEYFLLPIFPTNLALRNDWYIFAEYLFFFFVGYLIATNIDDLWVICKKSKYLGLGVGIIACIIYGSLYLSPGYIFIKAVLRALSVWSILFSVFGFAAQYLNKENKWVSNYANEAVYPFYILHQTAIIAIIYYTRNWNLSIFSKYVIVVLGTTLICWSLYHFLIRKIGMLRFLFGMRPPIKNVLETDKAEN